MSKMINFDSNDWNSIENAIKLINEIGEMQIGTTSEGEDILFDVGHDGEGDTLITEVTQKNGWVRKNIYHVASLYCEELYERGDR